MILDRIVSRKKEEVALLKSQEVSLPDGYREEKLPPPRGFREALLKYPEVSIIAEAKKASPSKGVICTDFNINKVVSCYEQHGAQAISVLTDVDFFQGSLLYLLEARKTVSLPVLRKDFIIDPLQIHEASVYGADAILLIAAILDEVQLREYRVYATEMGMDTLVEVHDERELERALQSGSNLIGINNRNLHDFTVDLETTFRLKKMIPDTIPVVSESGITSGEDIRRLREGGITAALIGETLMRAGTTDEKALYEFFHPIVSR